MPRTKTAPMESVAELRDRQQLLSDAIKHIERVRKVLPHMASLLPFLHELKAAKRKLNAALRESRAAAAGN